MERHERLGIRHQVLKKLRDSFLYSSEPTFTLSSGRKSRYYIDCKKVTLDPEGAFLIARLVLDAIADEAVDAIGGMTLGADPIAVAVAVVSYQEDRPISAFVVRKDPKAHGATSYIEGNLPRGSRIVVVDDVLTSGTSTERTIGILKEAGCVIVKVLALVDRKEGGRDRLATAGYPTDSLSPSRTCSRPERVSSTMTRRRPRHDPPPPRPAATSRPWRPAAVLLIVAFVAVGYANSLHGEFHLDDLTFKDDPALHLRALSVDALAGAVWHRRPVASLTFALNDYWGEHRVIGYHLVNVAIHAAAALALYALLVLVFHLPRAPDALRGVEHPAALIAALLWAMHPVQTQAVSYVVQRMTSLASLFYLLALIGYLKGRLSAAGQRAAWWTGAAGAGDRKSTRLNSSHIQKSRMPSSA